MRHDGLEFAREYLRDFFMVPKGPESSETLKKAQGLRSICKVFKYLQGPRIQKFVWNMFVGPKNKHFPRIFIVHKAPEVSLKLDCRTKEPRSSSGYSDHNQIFYVKNISLGSLIKISINPPNHLLSFSKKRFSFTNSNDTFK